MDKHCSVCYDQTNLPQINNELLQAAYLNVDDTWGTDYRWVNIVFAGGLVDHGARAPA